MFMKNRTAACQELKARGFKVAKTKFYNDCSAGLCRVEPDGSILESSLFEYVETVKLKKLGEPYVERKRRAQQVQRGFLLIPVGPSCLSKILSFLRETKKENEDGR